MQKNLEKKGKKEKEEHNKNMRQSKNYRKKHFTKQMTRLFESTFHEMTNEEKQKKILEFVKKDEIRWQQKMEGKLKEVKYGR